MKVLWMKQFVMEITNIVNAVMMMMTFGGNELFFK